MLEHKETYWSKVPGTERAMSIEPDEDYVIPIGKARIVQNADSSKVDNGESCVVISYGRGIHWTLEASKDFKDKVEVLDLRTLSPLDEDAISEAVKRHNKFFLLLKNLKRQVYSWN